MLEVQFRPIDAWPDKLRGDEGRENARFSATHTETKDVLERELRALDAEYPVIQVDAMSNQIRNDGQMRSDAKVGHPGVILSFESTYGPLRYWTDKYRDGYVRRAGNRGSSYVPGWQMNLRAIALSLEALRKVDRYGITSKGEQYQGWSQLGSGIVVPMHTDMSVSEAARWLGEAACMVSPVQLSELQERGAGGKALRKQAYRQASAVLHPDTGGSDEMFKKLQHVMLLLETLD